jgi:hypothetical protein
MALVVETGAQVANSNSYVTRAEYIAYAASIGVTITDAVAEQFSYDPKLQSRALELANAMMLLHDDRKRAKLDPSLGR